MMRILRNKRAQNTAEYAILIALVIAAAMAIQTYVKRALQGKVRDSVVFYADSTSELGETSQYEPYYLESSFTTTQDAKTVASEEEGGSWTRQVESDDTNRQGTQENTEPVNEG
jgi:hypothetical protein